MLPHFLHSCPRRFLYPNDRNAEAVGPVRAAEGWFARKQMLSRSLRVKVKGSRDFILRR